MDWAMMSYCREIESERERDERMLKRLMDWSAYRRKDAEEIWVRRTHCGPMVCTLLAYTNTFSTRTTCVYRFDFHCVCVYISSVQVFLFLSRIYVVYTVVIFRMFCSVNQTSSSYESSSPFYPVLSLSLSIHYGC